MELINGRTAEEIKRGLHSCSTITGCNEECPYYEDIYELGCNTQLNSDALALIQQLESAQQRWISVEERKPKGFVSVQVYMTDAGDFPSVREGYYVDEGRFYIPALHEFHPVSHWKPFDEPPEEGAHE